MKIKISKNTPDSRETFEHNINLIIEMGRKGKLHLTDNFENSGLDKIRVLPNRRINLHSVNEMARTIMNMAANEEEIIANEKER